MKLIHIVGNRPQFIKLAPLLRALSGNKDIKNIVIHSGQHYDFNMAQIFLDEFQLTSPDYNLEVGSGTHGEQTGQILVKLDRILMEERPDYVLVYGDTNTTLAGSLAAYKLHIPIAHVESGLREGVWRPEEINRKLSDHCSDFLFCPTKTAVECAQNEGIPPEKVFLTGDITYDAFLHSIKKIKNGNQKKDDEADYILLTLHRAETVDFKNILSEIVAALLEMNERILFPAHPRTVKYLKKFELFKLVEDSEKIELTAAVGYYEFLNKLLSAKLVITDSGGVIKEAFYAKKPCVTLDYTTEYKEIHESGFNLWAGKEKKSILDAVKKMKKVDASLISPEQVFGDGTAANKMVDIILTDFQSKQEKTSC